MEYLTVAHHCLSFSVVVRAAEYACFSGRSVRACCGGTGMDAVDIREVVGGFGVADMPHAFTPLRSVYMVSVCQLGHA